jgi:hypothetical protein
MDQRKNHIKHIGVSFMYEPTAAILDTMDVWVVQQARENPNWSDTRSP